MIEFDEFLGIIKKADKDEGTREITNFFKKLTSGEIGSKDISFSLFVQRQRRQHLMSAVIGEKGSVGKKKGRKIMENLKVKMEQEKQDALEQKESPRSGNTSPKSKKGNKSPRSSIAGDSKMAKPFK